MCFPSAFPRKHVAVRHISGLRACDLITQFSFRRFPAPRKLRCVPDLVR